MCGAAMRVPVTVAAAGAAAVVSLGALFSDPVLQAVTERETPTKTRRNRIIGQDTVNQTESPDLGERGESREHRELLFTAEQLC